MIDDTVYISESEYKYLKRRSDLLSKIENLVDMQYDKFDEDESYIEITGENNGSTE